MHVILDQLDPIVSFEARLVFPRIERISYFVNLFLRKRVAEHDRQAFAKSTLLCLRPWAQGNTDGHQEVWIQLDCYLLKAYFSPKDANCRIFDRLVVEEQPSSPAPNSLLGIHGSFGYPEWGIEAAIDPQNRDRKSTS